MFQLDVRSIILLTGLMGLLMSGVLFFLRRNYPTSIEGLREWALAPAIIFVASLLFGARGSIPDLLSIVAANLLVFIGTATYYFGTQRFFGLSPSYRLWGALILAVMPGIAWFGLVAPHPGARVVLISGAMALMTFAHCRLILQRGERRFSHYFTAATLFAVGVAQSIRFATSYRLGVGDGVFDSLSPVQTLYVLVYACAVLTVSIGMVLMATDRLRGELEYLATRDPLTGTLNRRAFIAAAEQEFARCRRHGHVMSIVLMDLDHFKAINDTHGHLVGDRVLRDFTARVAALLRLPDRLGRYGGEEFVLLLPETGRESAAVVAERIRVTAAAAEGVPAYTVSIGLATNVAADGNLDQILARADLALYEAKRGGRNRVALAPSLQEVA